MGYESSILAISELNVFVKVGYDHCIVGTYSNLDIIIPSTATDRQGCKKCTLVHFFWSYLATVSDRPPDEVLETYPSIYASVKGTSPPCTYHR